MTYLDHAATTPMRDIARDAWLAASSMLNPGGQYQSGRAARRALEEAREQIAELLDCERIEVIFTASGTEADNLAIRGLFAASPLRRIISTPIEHPAVMETVRALDADIDWLPVSHTGVVSSVEPLATPAALACCMWANNETGAVQPIQEIIAAAGGTPVHIDAVQAVGHIPVAFHGSGATTLAASAHKFGGPRGVGILLARRSPALTPVLTGGGQERGVRPGTVDVAGAVATAAALSEACSEMEAEAVRLAALRDTLREYICSHVDKVLVHTPEHALPGHLYVSFPGAEGDSLLMLFDAAGIECSTGSACSHGVNRPSDVLLAQGVAEPDARSAIRFTLGRTTTQADIDHVCANIVQIVERARIAGMA
ncbi:cysteine desulfurase family protein [Corynebacterium freiburgense]|uniref:cysteine desulfurase family protein n=1 Tax=Corynebacterium freiburgense TaxID=556548 RepID=UPI000419AF5D|nr:cysteine desulfurase family protein [Corynebacterium freiburgense]WJZ02393.1 Cysteine desulfurase [Corynebacterium freiburgense]